MYHDWQEFHTQKKFGWEFQVKFFLCLKFLMSVNFVSTHKDALQLRPLTINLFGNLLVFHYTSYLVSPSIYSLCLFLTNNTSRKDWFQVNKYRAVAIRYINFFFVLLLFFIDICLDSEFICNNKCILLLTLCLYMFWKINVYEYVWEEWEAKTGLRRVLNIMDVI